MNTKRGFTLIELLAVIIILAVIALIATPIVLNVVNNAKDSADMQSANGIADAARLYYNEAMLDENKKVKVDNVIDIYSDVSFYGEKPETGKLYVNSNGNVAMSIIIRDKCYIKNFNTKIEIRKKDNCDLGYVGTDQIKPTIEFSYNGSKGNNDWYISDVYLDIKVIDKESGPSKYVYCKTTEEDCNPTDEIIESGSRVINEDTTGIKYCVIGYDVAGNVSLKKCSETIKIDKVAPIISGLNNISVMVSENVDLTSGVIANDIMSGVDESFTYTPTSINTSTAGNTTVTYTVSDIAGNTMAATRIVTVKQYTWVKYNTISTTNYNWDQYQINSVKEYELIDTGSERQIITSISGQTLMYGCTDYAVSEYGSLLCAGSTWHSVGSLYFYGNTWTNYQYIMVDQILYRYGYQADEITYVIVGLGAKETLKETKGSFIKTITTTTSNSYPNDGKSGTYWYTYKDSNIIYSKGTTNYGEVYSNSNNSYPNNGRHTDGYWYVKK